VAGDFFMHWLSRTNRLRQFRGQMAQYGYALLAIDGVFKANAQAGRSILETNITDTRNNLVQQ